MITKFENIIDEAYYEFTSNTCKELVLDYENFQKHLQVLE